MTSDTIYPLSLTTHKATMIVHINKRSHLSISHLPDIVNDCEQQRQLQTLDMSHNDDTMKLTCKQIAHSLRIVADQMDKKYCQDSEFNRHLYYLSIRLMFQSIFSAIWTRSLIPFILMLSKTNIFLY